MDIRSPLVLILSIACGYYLYSSTVSEQTKRDTLQNKVVMVTGASSGIGEEVAYQLSNYGVKLILVARTESKLQKVRDNLLAKGFTDVNIIVFDFEDYRNSGSVITTAKALYGRIDIIVSNHGGMPWGPFLRVTKHQNPDFIERVFKVNYHSHVQLALAALPVLEESFGHIFFTSSLLGEVPNVMSTVYGSTKHALNGFLYSFQQSLLAEQSNVTLTVGAIGLIMTHELDIILRDKPIPGFVKGDLGECAGLIVSSLVTRDRTVSYPRFATRLARFMFQLNPMFNELVIGTAGYAEEVAVFDINEIRKAELNYQQGF